MTGSRNQSDRLTADNFIPAWVAGELVPVDKIEVHRRGLRHPAISVFVTRGRQILLQRRADSKYHTPGLWTNTCCTHPHWDETAVDCATRRLREELGIEGLVPVLSETVEYRADVGGGLTEHEVVDILLAEAGPDLQVVPVPDEVQDTRWIDLEGLAREIADAPERFTPWLRIYLAEHRDRIFPAAG
ncbi:isopentenyl-diphosphate delta-isomerase [Tabrizicola sp. J26]|uniref:isopentenyl-diphosphate delta-isomerase n=1 Tax=Alitabrizicola rongguiensis TaxID=2909234 RepID=UPI001F372E38|nr:isopentenyl-diphosphate delta-isomerase [Tabrizicola rongguiensis]MCF1710024.1 isopentenyl-diphosphate delta-isomerase [Tabrizicola rongguiensis]